MYCSVEKLIKATGRPARISTVTRWPFRERRVYGDAGYAGQKALIRQHAPPAKDFTQQRGRGYRYLSPEDRAKNRTKSRVRAKVEHAIGVIKRLFGFAKVRYRGLAKNAHRLFVTAALANLYLVRSYLLRRARESCA
jgi:IS5 family transposase